jgi:uncharacterized protein YqgV (UPF0045/DUF77 family)
VPGYNRAELTAELKVLASAHSEKAPKEQIEAARRAAGDSGLAREAGPETTALAGERSEVLRAMLEVIEASLDAGARAVQVNVETEGDSSRFGGRG